MSSLAPPAPVPEREGLTAEQFHGEVRTAGKPVVVRRLVENWPAVQEALAGDVEVAGYIAKCGPRKPVIAMLAPPEELGRFFYDHDLRGFNFTKRQGRLEDFLADLLKVADEPGAPAMAVQSEVLAELLPAFEAENRLDWLPDVRPRIWLGNRIRVAPHYDLMENVACCVAGRRRFTLFPPDQLRNLYAGPFELTPAGTPVSMVDIAEPDLERYPRFAEAWSTAQQVTLEPGDALYIPYMWWHAVESLEPVSILVNYWWSNADKNLAGPYDALLHAIAAYRHMPPAQREIWRSVIEHYAFDVNGDPGEHLPAHARGIMSPASPQLFQRLRQMLAQVLGGRA